MEASIEPPKHQSPKILIYDVETAPLLTWNWGLWKQNALDIEQDWYLLCFAYAWFDLEKESIGKVGFHSIANSKGFKPDSSNDKQLVKKLWDLMDEADIVIGQNSNSFDNKKANARFIIHGFPPPSPYQAVDTKVLAKAMFGFPSNGLKYLAKALGVSQKETTEGFVLWREAMRGDPTSWRKMESYNKADVKATAEVYAKMRPWAGLPGKSPHPNIGHFISSAGKVCTNCGNKDKEYGGKGFQLRKYYYTNASKFPVYQCNNCKTYSRSYRRVPQRTPETTNKLR